jgi:hypothetical protein
MEKNLPICLEDLTAEMRVCVKVVKDGHSGPHYGLFPYCDQFSQDGIAANKRGSLNFGCAVHNGGSRNVAMVFDDGVVFDQRLRIDDAIVSDGGASIDKGVVHDDRPLPKHGLA